MDSKIRNDLFTEPNLEATYEEAIRTLNSLQSNSATRNLRRQNQHERHSNAINQMASALAISGLSLESINSLPIIHVAGTKGKGMTCAFTETILRQVGLKTGFYSSPHLTAVRERIRINGIPISEAHFAKSFFKVYNRLKHLQNDSHECEMPNYFRFLTIMAFHVFLEENVEVLILEVGVGGSFDATNIIQHPVCVGITRLALEHETILGNTLPKIAMHKAGIMKRGCPVYTVNTHPPDILELLKNHATILECPFTAVTPLDLQESNVVLGVDDGAVAAVNAGLGVHLARRFLQERYPLKLKNFVEFERQGLVQCRWDGRFQQVNDNEFPRLTWFLDGAHTQDSIQFALNWFNCQTKNNTGFKVLVFNVTGLRNAEKLLKCFCDDKNFDLAIFCPMKAFKSADANTSLDNWSRVENECKDLLGPCRQLVVIWENLHDGNLATCLGSAEETREYLAEKSNTEYFPGIQVLVTGSLHLVGNFLQVLQPNRNNEKVQQ